MAKNVSLLGADYPNVPAVQLPQTGGGTATFYDIAVVDALNSDSATDALSAKQGKVLNEKATFATGGFTNILAAEYTSVDTTYASTGRTFTLAHPAIVRLSQGYNRAVPVAIGCKNGNLNYSTNVLCVSVPSGVVGQIDAIGFLPAGTYYIWASGDRAEQNKIWVDCIYLPY